MKVEVLERFKDKFVTGKYYSKGDVITVDDARGETMVKLGVAKAIEVEEPEAKKAKKKKTEE